MVSAALSERLRRRLSSPEPPVTRDRQRRRRFHPRSADSSHKVSRSPVRQMRDRGERTRQHSETAVVREGFHLTGAAREDDRVTAAERRSPAPSRDGFTSSMATTRAHVTDGGPFQGLDAEDGIAVFVLELDDSVRRRRASGSRHRLPSSVFVDRTTLPLSAFESLYRQVPVQSAPS